MTLFPLKSGLILSSFKKADGSYDIAGAGGELAKRAGYYGSIGAVTDFAVSTPGDLTTLSETFGFGESYTGDELEGSAKAAEFFKEILPPVSKLGVLPLASQYNFTFV